jgi:TonB family protein
MSCFIKRVLPFVLTLLLGLAVGSLFKSEPVPAGNLELSLAPPPPAAVMSQPVDYSRVFSSRDVTQKARILYRAEPEYTPRARAHQVEGTAILKAVLSSTGEVTDITVVKGLPDGLTDACVESMRQIKFVPAVKDGRPVSQYVQVEYNFNLY